MLCSLVGTTSVLKLVGAGVSATVVCTYQILWCHIQEDCNPYASDWLLLLLKQWNIPLNMWLVHFP